MHQSFTFDSEASKKKQAAAKKLAKQVKAAKVASEKAARLKVKALILEVQKSTAEAEKAQLAVPDEPADGGNSEDDLESKRVEALSAAKEAEEKVSASKSELVTIMLANPTADFSKHQHDLRALDLDNNVPEDPEPPPTAVPSAAPSIKKKKRTGRPPGAVTAYAALPDAKVRFPGVNFDVWYDPCACA
jgi:hypothetical protein